MYMICSVLAYKVSIQCPCVTEKGRSSPAKPVTVLTVAAQSVAQQALQAAHGRWQVQKWPGLAVCRPSKLVPIWAQA